MAVAELVKTQFIFLGSNRTGDLPFSSEHLDGEFLESCLNVPSARSPAVLGSNLTPNSLQVSSKTGYKIGSLVRSMVGKR